MSENNPENLPTAPESVGQISTPVAKAPSLKPQVQDDNSLLLDTAKFEHLYRVAQMFSGSSLVPEIYQNKPQNCFIACHVAHGLNIDPFMFMQNSYIVKGRPGIEGKLVIALINSRGPYVGGVQFELSGSGDSRQCVAFGVRDNSRRDEFLVTVKQAKDAGWWEKNQNWRVLTDLMLKYRSATFLARTNCPEILLGLDTKEELVDVGGVEVLSASRGKTSSVNGLLEGGANA